MERLRIPLTIALVTLILGGTGCGEDDPDPTTVLDRALTRERLSGFANGPDGPRGGAVSVQALGYEDTVLEQRRVAATPAIMSEIRQALGESGVRGIVDEPEYVETTNLEGVETDHVTGDLDVRGLASALERAGGDDVGNLAGVDRDVDLGDSLTEARFDLYTGRVDGTIRRLDLTLGLDDPDNALPPVRIRFSLSPDPS